MYIQWEKEEDGSSGRGGEGRGIGRDGVDVGGSDLSSLEESTPRGKCCAYFILKSNAGGRYSGFNLLLLSKLSLFLSKGSQIFISVSPLWRFIISICPGDRT